MLPQLLYIVYRQPTGKVLTDPYVRSRVLVLSFKQRSESTVDFGQLVGRVLGVKMDEHPVWDEKFANHGEEGPCTARNDDLRKRSQVRNMETRR